MAPNIPDRWIPYKACGKVIEGTRFICFKVPLRRTLQTGKKEITEIWDIKTLLSTIPNLGAVIDLTNTARYYDPKDLQAAGVLHRKILMPGRIIPPDEKVTEFMDACDEFLGKDCDFLIGVHCTHGLNRTGYMVCRYMRDRLGIDAKEAIKRFQLARGYQIERENYIADLLGAKPPPPNIGEPTTLKPINDEDELSYTPVDKNYFSRERESTKRYSYNGESWRDECRTRTNENEDCSNNSGRYVRHPFYNKNSREGNNSRYENDKGNDRRRSPMYKNRKSRYSSDDSSSSYDFRYDY